MNGLHIKYPNEGKKGNLKRYVKRILNVRTIVSILIAIVYCLIYIKYKTSIDFFRYSTVITVLFVIAIIDQKTRNVYFSTTFIASALSIIFIIIGFAKGIDPQIYIFGGILGGIFSAILAALNIIGWGDVEIFIVCGLLVGIYKVAIVAFISIVLSGIYGLYLIVIKKEKTRVAFGPYIIISLILTII